MPQTAERKSRPQGHPGNNRQYLPPAGGHHQVQTARRFHVCLQTCFLPGTICSNDGYSEQTLTAGFSASPKLYKVHLKFPGTSGKRGNHHFHKLVPALSWIVSVFSLSPP